MLRDSIRRWDAGYSDPYHPQPYDYLAPPGSLMEKSNMPRAFSTVPPDKGGDFP